MPQSTDIAKIPMSLHNMAFFSGKRRFECSKNNAGEELYPGVEAYINANPHKPLECAAAYFGVEQNPEITFLLPYNEIPHHYENIGQFIMADMRGLPRPIPLSPEKVEIETLPEQKISARVEKPKPAPTRERRQTSNRKARQENPYIKHVAAPQPEYQANIIFPDPILIPLGDHLFPIKEVDSVDEQQAAEAFVAQVLGLQPSPPIPAPVPVPELPEYDVMGLDASLGFEVPEIPVSFGCHSNLLTDEQLEEEELNILFGTSTPSSSPTIPSSDKDGSHSPKPLSPIQNGVQGGWREYEIARQVQNFSGSVGQSLQGGRT